jgi:putative Holliday junction resolvase
MRFMGLDVGEKRIGVALSDPEGLIASPRDTIRRDGYRKDVAQLLELAESEGVDEILVGMPYSLDGNKGPQAKKVTEFIEAMGRESKIKVIPWDERLSTAAAERALLEADMSRAGRRRRIDKVAAAFILQGYLDYRNHKEATENRGR